MKLRVKLLKFSAGHPIAILHKDFAKKASINLGERILIRKGRKRIIAVVDIATGLLDEDEVIVSTEISSKLRLAQNEEVLIEPALKPDSIYIIGKKMACRELSKEEIKKIISDMVKNALTEAEIAYFVSSVYKCGMSMNEIRNMTKAIIETGNQVRLRNKLIVDKHSIGGVPGRTTPIVVSICSTCGLVMPKTSSRAITTPAGTADALEVVCKVDFTVKEIKKIIREAGACIVWGGSLGLAPADDKIIQIERLLNLDSEAQLLSSIMAKKLAVGSKFILIEIPYGNSAKVTKKQALRLRRKFQILAKYFHVKIKCLLFETSQPLGDGIGPALEIKDVISILKREKRNSLLEKRALIISGKILEMTGKSELGKGFEKARDILESGVALKKFQKIIKAQKGKLDGIPEAKFKHDILATKSGKIRKIDIKKINSLARVLGCPADKYAGIYLHKHVGEKIKKSQPILTLYSESKQELEHGLNFYKKVKPVKKLT